MCCRQVQDQVLSLKLGRPRTHTHTCISLKWQLLSSERRVKVKAFFLLIKFTFTKKMNKSVPAQRHAGRDLPLLSTMGPFFF